MKNVQPQSSKGRGYIGRLVFTVVLVILAVAAIEILLVSPLWSVIFIFGSGSVIGAIANWSQISESSLVKSIMSWFKRRLRDWFKNTAEDLGLLGPRKSEEGDQSNRKPEFILVPHRNRFFVDQHRCTLRQIQDNWESEKVQQQILWGFAGIGKTQIALEFAYEYSYEYSKKTKFYWYVVWLDASNSLDDALEKFKKQVGHSIASNTEDYFENWIIDQEKKLQKDEKWLLIIDNCSSIKDFKKARSMLQRVSSRHRHVLFTMQMSPGTLPDAKAIEVRGMTKDDGTQLLVGITKDAPSLSKKGIYQNYWKGAEKVIDKLGGNPLAIHMAGAYMHTNRTDPDEYLKRYTKQFEAIITRPLDNPHYVGKTIATTFRLSFAEIEKLPKDGAEQALLLCAFLATAPIPKDIVRFMPQKDSALPWFSDDWEMDRALKRLFDLSFIEHDDDKKVLMLHAMVMRDTIRAGLYPSIKRKMNNNSIIKQKEYAVRAVSIAFSKAVINRKEYLPHIKECVTYIKENALASLEALQLLYTAGLYLKEHPDYKKQYDLTAEDLLKNALEMRHRLWKKTPQDTEVSDLQTDLTSLTEFYRETLHSAPAILESVPLLLNKVSILNNLGNVHIRATEYKEAEEKYNEAMQTLEEVEELLRITPNIALKTMCEEHKEQSEVNLASLYACCRYTDKYEKAKDYYQKAIKRSKELIKGIGQTSEQAYIQLVIRLNNLASLYLAWGEDKAHDNSDKYQFASQYYEESLSVYYNYLTQENSIDDQEGERGPHPLLNAIWNNLAAFPRGTIDKHRKASLKRYARTLKLIRK